MTDTAQTTASPGMKPATIRLWERYKESGDPTARERLILQYSPLVKYVAGRVSVGLPNTVEQGDLVSYGMFGLMDALERFDLSKGFKFETYAVTRIKGAIIDELRSVDWVPRSVRSKAKKVERALAKLERELDRTPTEEEIAAELEIDVAGLRKTLTQMSLTSIAALDERMPGDDGRRSLGDTLADDDATDPQQALVENELRDLLGQTINRMTEREKTVIVLYYFEGMTLAEIGEVLGVTESRVCQIHTKAVLGLRTKMTAGKG